MNIQRIITLLLLALFIAACAEGTDEVNTDGGNNSSKSGNLPNTTLLSDINPETTPYSRTEVTVTLSCEDLDNDCDKIYYTLDGTDPTQDSSDLYTMPFTISTLNAVVEIRYFSVDLKGNRETDIQSTTYTMDATIPSSVTPSPIGGSFSVTQYVTFDCQDSLSGCKTIRYSTDNTQTNEEQFSAIEYPGGEVPISNDAILRYYAVDYAGNRTGTVASDFVFNNTMTNVSNLVVTVGDGQVTLNWVNPADVGSTGFTGVKIFRSETGYPSDPTAAPLHDTASTTITSYIDSGLTNGTTYYYRIFAYGDATPTNYASGAGIIAVPVDNTPPASVTGFTATGGNQSVALNWTNPTDADFAGVMIRKSTNSIPNSPTSGNFVYNGNENGFSDTNAQNNTRYYYSIFAYDSSGNYATDIVSATANTLDTLAPASVSSFEALAREGSVQLRWANPSNPDLASVVIRRDTTTNPLTPQAGTGIYSGTGTSVVDTNVTNTTQYFYSAFAIDATGNVSDAVHHTAIPNVEYLSSTSPADGDTEVSVNLPVVTATFIPAIADTTVGSNSIELLDSNRNPVIGTVDFYNSATNILAFTPAESLALKTTYTATLSGALTDTSGGKVLADNYPWTFETSDGGWNPVSGHLADYTALGLSSSGYSTGSIVKFGRDGLGLAIWTQPVPNTSGGTNRVVYANEISTTAGWDPAAAVPVSSRLESVDSSYLDLAMNNNGVGVVVWVQNNTIWANTYNSDSGNWGTSSPLTDITIQSRSPKVDINDNGDIVVAWLESGSVVNVRANVFSLNTVDWNNLPESQLIETNDEDDARKLKVVMNESGNVLASWVQRDTDGDDSVLFTRYIANAGWDSTSHQALGNPDLDSGWYFAHIGLDEKGRALFVWDENTVRIWSQSYDFNNDELGEPQQIGLTQDGLYQLMDPAAFAMNESGVALMVFHQTASGLNHVSYINKYEPGLGWKGTKALTTEFGEYAMAIDAAGNAIIVMDIGSTMRAYRYAASSNWNALSLVPVVDIEVRGDGTFSNEPAVGVDDKGNALATWSKWAAEVGGGYAQIANQFKYRDPAPELEVTITNASSDSTALTLEYTVTNSGDIDTGAFEVHFWFDPVNAPAVGDIGDDSITISGLTAGASTSGTITFATTATSGTSYAVVDSSNLVAEKNEFNNVTTGVDWVIALPDLTVTLDAAMSDGANLQIAYTVTNAGNGDSQGFDVEVFADSSVAPAIGDVGDFTISTPALAAGASVSGSVTVATTAASGTSYAIVDSGNTILEHNDLNNISFDFPWGSYATISDFENGNIPAQYISSGDASWVLNTTEGAFSSQYSINSGAISDNQQSCITISATATDIYFSYKVSSESGYDRLRFYIDTVEQDNWSGTTITHWSSSAFTTTAGTHDFMWCYTKDGSQSRGEDAAWIDSIALR